MKYSHTRSGRLSRYTRNTTVLLWVLMLLLLPVTGIAQTQREPARPDPRHSEHSNSGLSRLIFDSSEHFSDIDSANLEGLLDRIGDARVVLLGEASHGTAEFYDMRARITRELIEKKGFTIVAAEAQWPDSWVINHFVRNTDKQPVVSYQAFGGFPSWMWANQSMRRFLSWLKDYNRQSHSPESSVGFYGLDFYNMFGSIEAVLNYLRDADPGMAVIARRHYACLMPWSNDPAAYSDFMASSKHRGCGYEAHAVLQNLCSRQNVYRHADRQGYFNAKQNARMVMQAEYYYRSKHRGIDNSWNQRDQSMFEALLAVFGYHGHASKAVVWAHNTHIGDARATDMSAAGEINLGQRVRQAFGDRAYLIGMGTDHGTVLAASEWGGTGKVMRVPSSHRDSYEYLFHKVEARNFLLPLRYPKNESVRKRLLEPRMQRGIGSTYSPRPEDELKYHYYQASLPLQFDEYIWFDQTEAVKP